MKRFRSRKPKTYAWPLTQEIASASGTSVANIVLVEGGEFARGGIPVQQARTLNIKRIVGDILFTVPPAFFDDETDAFVYGHIAWCVMIRDQDDDTIYDPETNSISAETLLAVGLSPSLGVILATDAFVGGTGNAKAFASGPPPSYMLHLDILTNRRLTADQVLEFRWTRAATGSMILGDPAVEYVSHTQVRTLVLLPD